MGFSQELALKYGFLAMFFHLKNVAAGENLTPPPPTWCLGKLKKDTPVKILNTQYSMGQHSAFCRFQLQIPHPHQDAKRTMVAVE